MSNIDDLEAAFEAPDGQPWAAMVWVDLRDDQVEVLETIARNREVTVGDVLREVLGEHLGLS